MYWIIWRNSAKFILFSRNFNDNFRIATKQGIFQLFSIDNLFSANIFTFLKHKLQHSNYQPVIKAKVKFYKPTNFSKWWTLTLTLSLLCPETINMKKKVFYNSIQSRVRPVQIQNWFEILNFLSKLKIYYFYSWAKCKLLEKV